MKVKEQGYVLSIDQASNSAGCSLWLNGELQATINLLSDHKNDPFPLRMRRMVDTLDSWLSVQLPSSDQQVNKILFEGVRSRLVLCTVGAFCLPGKIQSHVKERDNFVESTRWKVWARKNGALGPLKDIKGVQALKEVGFPVEKYSISSDDVADSILIYLTWRDL